MQFGIYPVRIFEKAVNNVGSHVRKKKIKEINRDDILQLMKKPYKKISYQEHAMDKHQVQPYLKNMNIAQARMKFKLKTQMTPTVQMNFSSSAEFATQLWTCSGCSTSRPDGQVVGRRDTQSHIMICPGYSNIRQDLDLENDRDLVDYFSQVVKVRMEAEDEC